MDDAVPLMQLRNLRKTFGTQIVALRGVDLDIRRGRVHGLIGANGAGKSTLIKILSGAFSATDGKIIWKGAEVHWTSPKQANEMGVATIHQHIPLVPTLSVIENVFMGSTGLWRVDRSMYRRFGELCERVGYHLEPDMLVSDLSIGARQMVAIFQALATGADLIVMDEPTASLAIEEREIVYATVRKLSKAENKAILFVSHFLDEILALTDEVTVLRDGQAVMRAETKGLNEGQIAEAIVGKQVVALEKATLERSRKFAASNHGKPILEVNRLSSPGRLAPISLELRRGEVLGVAGLLGSGRSELLHAIFGADPHAKGEVRLEGEILKRSTGAAVKAGLALVPEDRFKQGLVPDFEIWRNTTLPALERVSKFRFLLDRNKEVEIGETSIRRLAIKAPDAQSVVTELSGGNAQKVTIAKWLFSDVKVFLLDEPTAGIDIGAKTEILLLVRQLAEEGKSVIIVSSEFEELMAACDRIIVLRDGHQVSAKAAHETNEHELVMLAGGKHRAEPSDR